MKVAWRGLLGARIATARLFTFNQIVYTICKGHSKYSANRTS